MERIECLWESEAETKGKESLMILALTRRVTKSSFSYTLKSGFTGRLDNLLVIDLHLC